MCASVCAGVCVTGGTPQEQYKEEACPANVADTIVSERHSEEGVEVGNFTGYAVASVTVVNHIHNVMPLVHA